MRSYLRLSTLTLATLLPAVALAAPSLSGHDVRAAVAAYAKARGIRPDQIQARVTGESRSGKSTRAIVTVGGKEIRVAVNEKTSRVQTRETGSLVEGLLTAHTPLQRAATKKGSSYATKVLAFMPGRGIDKVSLRGKVAPIGRPRAGQSRSAQALDALSLGAKGSVTLALGTPITAGNRGAGVRVRENGLGSGDDIINQTPGLVEVGDGSKWYRLGYAGYKTAGDLLLTKNAIDAIPVGTTLTTVRITDAPNAPHPHGIDPTDNAVASARGVRGFDLVSVQAIK
jgi:hypothetical protein